MAEKQQTSFDAIKYLKIALAAILGFATGYMCPNNPVEQMAEAYIHSETGVRVDLSAPWNSPKQLTNDSETTAPF